MQTELEKAILLRNDNQFKEAEEIFLDLYEKIPNDPEINYHFAWLHDKMGKEKKAVPYYEKAIELGLQGKNLMGALLGLGSTYRTLGMYEQAKITLEKGYSLFPENNEFKVFLAMVLYNLKDYTKAMEILLKILVETSSDMGIKRFEKAILFYADKLDQIWEE